MPNKNVTMSDLFESIYKLIEMTKTPINSENHPKVTVLPPKDLIEAINNTISMLQTSQNLTHNQALQLLE